ncbi:hypothetical protein, partial [Desulfobotulus alkaliphilus]|uniref:hypothetical protein n=1 Tax=Desulfobotulus alkaliphilus TaxID=622671 RepID=UPI001C946178
SQTVNHGESTSFTLVPNTGYSIFSISGCGGSLHNASYKTDKITQDCTISAVFKASSSGKTSSSGGGCFMGAITQ